MKHGICQYEWTIEDTSLNMVEANTQIIMNAKGKIELYEDNTFSVTGQIPDKLKEYLHTKVEPSVAYSLSSLVKCDKADILLLGNQYPDLAYELDSLLHMWVARIEAQAKSHKQKQFQLRRNFLKEEDGAIERYILSKDLPFIDYKGKTFVTFPKVFFDNED